MRLLALVIFVLISFHILISSSTTLFFYFLNISTMIYYFITLLTIFISYSSLALCAIIIPFFTFCFTFFSRFTFVFISVQFRALTMFNLAPIGMGRASFRLAEIIQLGRIPVYLYEDFPWSPYEGSGKLMLLFFVYSTIHYSFIYLLVFLFIR